MLEVYGKTDRGNVRENNEDRICYPRADTTSPAPKPEAGQLLIVADGVGGAQAGEHASKLTVDTMKRIYYYGDHGQDPRLALQQAIAKANQEVLSVAKTDPTRHGAASTVTAAVVKGNQLYVANVGDSRTYLIRANGQLKQITKDHSLTEQKIDRGLIRRDQAKMDPDSHIITRSIGLEPTVEIDLFPAHNTPAIALQPGDAILLCSDGLTDLVHDTEIAQIVTHHQPKQAVSQLIKLAKRNGGHDNISAIVGRMPGGVPPARLAWVTDATSAALNNRWLWLVPLILVIGGLLFLTLRDGWPKWPLAQPSSSTPVRIVSNASPTVVITPQLRATPQPSAPSLSTAPTATRVAPRATTEAPQPPTLVPTALPAATGSPTQAPLAAATPTDSSPSIVAPDLIEPDENFSIAGNDKTEFAWKWSGKLQANQGFQISVWPVGQSNKQGIHDAKETIDLHPDNTGTYHLSLEIATLFGNGDYQWSVAVAWLDPYQVIAESQSRSIKINVAKSDNHDKGKPNSPAGAATRTK